MASLAARLVFQRTFSSTTAGTISRKWRIAPNRRTNLIFGANTDVGKTLVSAGLVRASLEQRDVHYIKPLQCGGSDQAFIEKHVKSSEKHRLIAETLFSWDTPASPHTASLLENKPVSDEQVLNAIYNATTSRQHDKSSVDLPMTTYIETAGGVLSPSSASPLNASPKHAITTSHNNTQNEPIGWGWVTQADLYQPLLGHAPVILVGDGRLGGISATLAALESLVVRGYDVVALVMVNCNGHDNLSAVRDYAQRPLKLRSGTGEALFATARQSMIALPPIPPPNEPLWEWYDSTHEIFGQLDAYLENVWQGQVEDLQNLGHEASNVLWPNNPMDDDSVTVVDSASGDQLHILVADESNDITVLESVLDTGSLGMPHGDSSMALVCAAAAGRYGHVSPPAVHAPAVSLCQKLLGSSGPGHGWAHKVLFTNDRSSAMEIALQMGIKTYQHRNQVSNVEDYDWVVCAQEGCHHGDTLGAINVGEPTMEHPWYESKGLCLETPTIGFRDGILSISFPESLEPSDGATYEFESIEQAMDVRARLLNPRLHSQYKEMIEMQWLVHEHSGVHRKIASVVLEPILLMQGGIKFVDPLWQRALIDIAKSRGVPVIFDETCSGLYQLGVKSCFEFLHSPPDIASYSNLLTGGVLPMSVTLASEEVFEACLGHDDQDGEPLLCNDLFAAHPAGCVSAIQALDAYHAVLGTTTEKTTNGHLMLFDENLTKELARCRLVEESFTLGTVLAVTIVSEEDESDYFEPSKATKDIVERLRVDSVLAHNQGNVIYAMASPMASQEECSRITDCLHRGILATGEEL